MSTVTSIIDSLTAPPFATLQQVLDTGGPYGPGDHQLTTFHTDGSFLLPAGTYDVGGTYGLMVVVNGTIPAAAGFKVGWISNDGNYDESEFEDPIVQVVQQHVLPLTGAFLTTTKVWVNTTRAWVPWQVLLGSGARVGLHVEPNWHVDLYYLCIL